MNILKYNLIIIILLLLVAFNGCTNKNKKTNKNIIAEIGEEKIELEKIDSLLNDQIYEIRLNALENEISKKLLEIEAKKQNISLEKLVNTEINKKAKDEGMITMSQDGFLKAKQGITSIEEIIRVTQE